MIAQFLLLIAEKLITSGSRFALIFFVLGSSERTIANDFFYITSAVTLLITLCHLGTDTLIVGKGIRSEGVNQIFLTRFTSSLVAISLLLFTFEFNINSKTYIAIIFALLGASLPIKQLKALSTTDRKTIIIDRIAPEITCGFLRFVGIAIGTREADILIILFFAPEIIYGILNSLNLYKNKLNIKAFKKIVFEKEINYAILWSVISILSLYGLQRGDILLITSSSEALSLGVEKIIKYQQFFDISGLLTIATIPFIKNYINGNRSPTALIIATGACGSLLSLVTLELFDQNKFLSYAITYICRDLPFYQISIIFGLGLITYTSIIYLGLLTKQKLIAILMSACLAFKALCFTLLLQPDHIILYSFTSATFFAVVFIFGTYLNDLYLPQKLEVD